MEADCFSLPPVPGPSRLWRLSNLIMAVFFALAGAVQINDPDPGLWIVVYSVPACLALIVSLNPPITDNIMWRSISDLHSAACVVGSAVLGYSLVTTAQNNILHEEEGRNSLGGFHLIIAIFLCLFPFVMWLYIYVNTEMRESWPSHCKTAI
ncbi:transmembrane protein 220 isoform X2 [Protobothrops mucrosquamatus]|uniref:transmembrane protein 220 isoform X2 n=1 Tax=Protobothrops mucrosquamatus TaxID=103944 RepID=UPI0007756E36|nr:transmembrane protein 220 isoform X2 [Protobothrops mucrosquamatus]